MNQKWESTWQSWWRTESKLTSFKELSKNRIWFEAVEEKLVAAMAVKVGGDSTVITESEEKWVHRTERDEKQCAFVSERERERERREMRVRGLGVRFPASGESGVALRDVVLCKLLSSLLSLLHPFFWSLFSCVFLLLWGLGHFPIGSGLFIAEVSSPSYHWILSVLCQ